MVIMDGKNLMHLMQILILSNLLYEPIFIISFSSFNVSD